MLEFRTNKNKYTDRKLALDKSLNKKNFILPIIVLAQFCCTSIWFAGNAVIDDLISVFDLQVTALGYLTSAIQLGFITGTLIFAFFTIADRFSPSKVFFVSALLAALFNIAITLSGNTYESLLLLRFLAGICLAGIYPVGMKIASDYFDKGLGKSLGFLVGALVLGTAFPHLLNAFLAYFRWNTIIYTTSIISLLGGIVIVLFVPDGPFRKPGQALKWSAIFSIFKPLAFRKAAVGYFGHMWELYTFWAFVPLLLISYNKYHGFEDANVSLLSFIIIAAGALGCIIAGYLSNRISTQKVAYSALFISGLCCLLLPVIFYTANPFIFTSFLIIWGITVVADSPLFSTLVAQNAIPHLKGSALTLVNSIGFSITILSIQCITWLNVYFELHYILPILGLGAVFGLGYKKLLGLKIV
jgi:MFS family permease